MSARDELVGLIGDYHVWSGDEGCSGKDAAAGAILAAGYSKPRTISTVDELDALGNGSAILDASGVAWINDGDSVDEWGSISEDYGGGPIWASGINIDLPATVLYTPKES